MKDGALYSLNAAQSRFESLPSSNGFVYRIAAVNAPEWSIWKRPLTGVKAITLVNEHCLVVPLVAALNEYSLAAVAIACPFVKRKHAGEVISVPKSAEHRLRQIIEYMVSYIEPEIYHDRKAQLLMDRQKLRDLHTSPAGAMPVIQQVSKFLELAKNAHLLYKRGEWREKRELLLSITSNRVLNGKNLEFTLETPFRLIAEREKVKDGGPPQDVHRTVKTLIKSLFTLAVKLSGVY